MSKPFQMKADYCNSLGSINGMDAYRDDGKGAIKKEAFLKDGRKFFRAVITVMKGWSGEVRINRGGMAVSGEVYLDLSHPDYAKQIHVQLSALSFGGRDGDNLSLLVQLRENKRIVGANIWLNANMNSDELAAKLLKIIEREKV